MCLSSILLDFFDMFRPLGPVCMVSRSLFWRYSLLKTASIFGTIFLFWVMNTVFMNQLWCPINPEEKYWGILVLEKYWGITVLKDIFAVGRSEKFFPQYCFCDYMLFKLANRHHITVQCFLHANAINEKVFCVLYFYLFFLMITSCFAWVCFAMEILKFALRCPGCSCRGMCSMKYHLGMNGFFICSFIVNTRGRHYIQSLIDTKLRRKFCANVTDLPIADNAVLPQFQRRRHVSL